MNESLLLTALVVNTLVLLSLCIGFTVCASVHVLSNRSYDKQEGELENESANAATNQIQFLLKALSQHRKQWQGNRSIFIPFCTKNNVINLIKSVSISAAIKKKRTHINIIYRIFNSFFNNTMHN